MGWEVENQQIGSFFPLACNYGLKLWLAIMACTKFNQNLIKNWDEKWKINKLVDFFPLDLQLWLAIMACNYSLTLWLAQNLIKF